MKLPKFVQKTQSAPPVRMFDDRPAPSMASSHDRPRGSVGRVDVKFAARLPEAAQRTMRDLADEADEMNVMSHALHERREKIREAMGNAEARISQMRSRLNSYRNNSEPAIEDQRKIIAECRADLDRLDARMAQLGAKARVLSQLIEGAGDLVRRVDREKPIMLFSGASPAPRKGEDAADAVEARRRRLRELEADFSRTTVAPKLSADMKAQEVARIEFLAKQGAPSAFATIEQGREVIWPTTSAELNGQSGSATIPDILAIIAHLCRDQMIAAVVREIDLMADDAAALSDSDREKQLTQIKQDVLAIEREDVHFTRMAIMQGAGLTYRGDTDPRALLGLSDDMPAPRNDN